jgi:hypothetical protein
MEWAGWRQNCCFESARIRKSLAKKKEESAKKSESGFDGWAKVLVSISRRVHIR